jgi:dienelactone hydrolase
MEHKDGTIGGGRAAMRRLKVTGEDVRLADPVVGEKAIGHGHLAICANLYEREGGGSDGNPDDVAAKVRAEGGIADSQMVGDTEVAVKWMRAQPNHNGKVGLFGSCSGGRHAFIYACQRKDVDACAELWGGRVVMGKEELNTKTPVAPIDMTKDLCCPLLKSGHESRRRSFSGYGWWT